MAATYKTMMCWIFILVVNYQITKYGCVDGIPTLNQNDFEPKLKGTLKTIKADGYLIDCVDIYKQPALANPSDLQMEPSLQFQRELNKTNNILFDKIDIGQPKPFQNWQKYGKCPKGTIPIRRNWNTNGTNFPNAGPAIHEYAQGDQIPGHYHGGGATFTVWQPVVEKYYEMSLTQLWIVAGNGSHRETIEAGWIVYPSKFNDSRVLLFIFWTADGYKTHCYNHECNPGFLQTSESTCIGCPIVPSQVGGKIEKVRIDVWRDQITGYWWLYVDNNEIGYFPRQLFSQINFGAERVSFGGEIVHYRDGGRHTATHMGSGHFPAEGSRKASFIHNAHVMTQSNQLVDATLTPQVTHPGCYDMMLGAPGTSFGIYFYYGGPGYSQQHCP